MGESWFEFIIFSSLAIGIFNLVPALPLDGVEFLEVFLPLYLDIKRQQILPL